MESLGVESIDEFLDRLRNSSADYELWTETQFIDAVFEEVETPKDLRTSCLIWVNLTLRCLFQVFERKVRPVIEVLLTTRERFSSYLISHHFPR